MNNILRFQKPNELAHIRSCIVHVEKRSVERFGTYLGEFEQCELVDSVKSGKIETYTRQSTYQVWIKFRLNGKTCFALYNESLEIIQTLYTAKMMEKLNYALLAA